MSKGKKQPQKGKTIKLSDAILQYNLKNYTGALTRLRAAQIKPDEAAKAQNLQYALSLRLAFSDIVAHNYPKAIQRLQPFLPHNPIASAFAGIAHLYLLEYDLAQPLLKNAANTYPTFHFYYILSQIYKQKDVDLNGFKSFFAVEWGQCTDNQKQYCETIIHLFNNQIEDAKRLVVSLKNESHFQHINFVAFQRIFDTTSEHQESLSEKVKPLYRLLLNEALTTSESDYFKALDKEIGVLGSLLSSRLDFTSTKAITAQYNQQKVLDENTLAQIMQVLPAEQRPYIAYNQAVNAYNQTDFDIAENAIKHVIVKYADDFLQVPESLSLYLNLVQQEDVKIYPTTFWAVIKKWLSIQKDNLSIENLDALGWVLFDSITQHPELSERLLMYEIAKIVETYPSVFALKYALILFPSSQVAPHLVKDTRLDLFSLPNAEKHKTLFSEKFRGFMSILSPYENTKFSFLDDSGLPKTAFNKQMVYYGECFMLAVKKYPIPTQNSIALEGFKIIHEHIKKGIDDNPNAFPKDFYEQFLNTYKRLLAQFPQNETTKIYENDIKSLEFRKYIIEFKKFTRYASPTVDFLKFLQKLPQPFDNSLLWRHFCERIDDSHFSEIIADCLVNFIEALIIHLKNDITASKNEIDNFVKAYKNVIKQFGCEHPTTFYGHLIKYILKKKNISNDIAYYFCVQYIEELTLNYTTEPKQYNAVADFLNWINAVGYYKKPVYDAQLIGKLKKYLITVNKVKKLKGLDTTIRNIASFA